MTITESAKFIAWHQAELGKGLIDLKCFPGSGMSSDSANVESFFRELNQVNDLYEKRIFVERTDIL